MYIYIYVDMFSWIMREYTRGFRDDVEEDVQNGLTLIVYP